MLVLYKYGKESLSARGEFWVSILVLYKLPSTEQTFGAKTHKKCCHVGIFGGCCPLAIAL
jgi:hypothetical protein